MSLPPLSQLPIGVGEHELAAEIWKIAKQHGPLTHITLIDTNAGKIVTEDILNAPFVLQNVLRLKFEQAAGGVVTLYFNETEGHWSGFGLADLLMSHKWPNVVRESSLLDDETLENAMDEIAEDVEEMGDGNEYGQNYPEMEEVAPIMADQVNETRRRESSYIPETDVLSVRYIGDGAVVLAWVREVYRPIRSFLLGMVQTAHRQQSHDLPGIIGSVRIMWTEDK